VDLEIDKCYAVVTHCSRSIFSLETEIKMDAQTATHIPHTPNDIGKTILSLGAILVVFLGVGQMQKSGRDDIRPELAEIRSDMRKIEEKLNLVLGQQDVVLRRLNMVK
jgi:hypothetical protein